MLTNILKLWLSKVVSAWRNLLPAIAMLTVLVAGSTAHAATYTWTGVSGTNWNNAGDWSALPVSGGVLVFDSPGAGTLTDDLMTSAGSAVAGITFTSAAPAYTINPSIASVNGFTLTGPIANNSTSAQIINDPIIMTAARTFTTTAGGGNITLGGNISGSGGAIVLAGSGMLVLTGSNSYTAGISLSSSVSLQLQANSGNTTSGTTAAMPAQGMSLAQLPSGSTIELRADSAQAANGIVEFNANLGNFRPAAQAARGNQRNVEL